MGAARSLLVLRSAPLRSARRRRRDARYRARVRAAPPLRSPTISGRKLRARPRVGHSAKRIGSSSSVAAWRRSAAKWPLVMRSRRTQTAAAYINALVNCAKQARARARARIRRCVSFNCHLILRSMRSMRKQSDVVLWLRQRPHSLSSTERDDNWTSRKLVRERARKRQDGRAR